MRKASESEFRSISTLKGYREEQRKIKRTKKDYPVGMGGKKNPKQTIISQKPSEDNIARRKMSSVSNAANKSSTMQTEN